MKQKLYDLMLLSLPVLLILFAPQVYAGASNGLLLWFRQVLPVLFPFSFVLQMILSANTLSTITPMTAPVIRKLLHVSPACSFCLLCGFLCGFPMGTLTASQAFKQKIITQDEAQLLSAVCNHASPMFFTGYILNQILSGHPLRTDLIWIFYASPLIWLLLRYLFSHTHHTFRKESTHISHDNFADYHGTVSFRNILFNSCELMLKIGVCMMFFSILQSIIRSLPFIPESVTAILALFLEITSGSMAIRELSWPEWLQTMLIMGGTSFGGLCTAFQSYTILHTQKLSFIQYLTDKSAVGIITAALVWILYQIT